VRLTTLGDLLLDVVVHLDAPLVIGDDRVAVTHTGAGGQAANVAAWAQSLGAEARVVCKRGADAAGELAAREFSRYGARIDGPCAGRGGVVVSFAAAGDRTMASDRGDAPQLRPDELDDSWFDCDVLHLSGYSLLREPISAAATHAARAARQHGARISVDLSTWTLVDDAFRARVLDVAPDIVFANEPESEALGALDATWVVKRGEQGIVVDGKAFPAVPVEAVDATGAGDALAAGFLVGGPEVGLAAAARCCAKLGSMP
jgi:ribokinase